jgi:hypothetical protein
MKMNTEISSRNPHIDLPEADQHSLSFQFAVG